MSSFDEERLITKSRITKHRISKYEFRPIVADELESIQHVTTPHTAMPQAEDIAQHIEGVEDGMDGGGLRNNMASIERELIEQLLKKTDELSHSLANLQRQLEQQQLEMEERITTARNDAYKDGRKEGEEHVRQALEAETQKERATLVESAINLGKAMQQAQTHLHDLEKELSAIALDIAKEVIAKEVEQDSAAIASALAKELLGRIADSTDVVLRVCPLDYHALQEHLQEYTKLTIEADNAITKGGVIIANGGGIIDGSITSRYKTLKQSVLENLRE